MLRLVVACGGGIFTTSVVSEQVSEILKKARIQHVINPAKITEIANITDADLIVVTGKFGTATRNVVNIPIISGLALLTGVGSEEFAEELVSRARAIEEAKKSGNA